MDEYPSNSFRAKMQQQTEPEAKVEKVVSGTVKTKSKSGITKFTDIFFASDIASVKTYIWQEILVPAFRRTLSEVMKNGTDMLIFSDAEKRKKETPANRYSYRNYYDRPEESRRDSYRQQTRSGYSYNDVIFDNRGDAEEVLNRMDELIDKFGIVSVADLYDMAGITGNYTDNKYGWTDISNAKAVRVQDGYVLKLPRAMPIG